MPRKARPPHPQSEASNDREVSEDLSQSFTSTITSSITPDSCIKILLATDNHIGYAESDPVRGRDSINAFREILQLALANDVDMVLLAGDLFHENRPSRTSMYQTIAALRDHCMGSRPISLELISDEGIGIARNATWPGVNYEDQNLNIGLPVFSIHGNHDDPQGTGDEGALCALDILSASGLINYFGRLELPGSALDDEEARETGLHIKPVLLQKGDTKLALYGMGNIRDERFHYELNHDRIKMFRPAEDPEDWFNILLVHQNRVPHGMNNYLPDYAFGDETDLVVWGHEHDCINKAVACPVTDKKYFISQPGSSIATSLAKGESIPKHVALLKIQGKEFQMEPIRLRSVRPFLWEEVNLQLAQDIDGADLRTKAKVNQYLKGKVEELVAKANAEWDMLHPGEDESKRLLPLIRLRVDYSGGPSDSTKFEIGNPQRFGQEFEGKVANIRDIVQFHRRSTVSHKTTSKIDQPDNIDDDLEDLPEQVQKIQVSSLVHKYLEAQNLGVLPEKAMERAVEEFVDKGDSKAMSNLLKRALKHERFLIAQSYEPHKEGPEFDDMEREMTKAKQVAESKLGAANARSHDHGSDDDDDDDDDHADAGDVHARARRRDSMDDGSENEPQATQGQGQTKLAANRKAASAAASKGKSAKALFNSDDDDDDESDGDYASGSPELAAEPIRKAATRKPPAKSAPRKAPAATRKTPVRTTTKAKPKGPVVDLVTDSDESGDSAPSRKRKR